MPVPPLPEAKNDHLNEIGAMQAMVKAIRTRVLTGLILALPIALTLWIVYWLYSTIQGIVLLPTGRLTAKLFQNGPPPFWWENVVAPFLGVVVVLCFLYVLGLLVHSSLLRAVDWVLLRVPVVTTIYKALTNVAQSLSNQMQSSPSKRVVLVEFPHPGMRALAFVTNTLTDPTTNQTILCVCVLTGVMPPAGFTLHVPEESVTNLDWSVNQALQAILSGGMTSPGVIHFSNGLHVAATGGPLIDPHGNPIEPEHAAEN
ncbi:Uncharacterized membrane protein [Singulisphaera sp. GP187]|uniref:DUF502 domain-containing protein n=1 Tax=Singulisphaera sp. GP187 TaxID=1882752 RepID=UPI0009261088|nr:DUF502 domain-containing protein [Singulisphaera sp. GP187]SIO66630.1 Uncharacterized membrane protein [Singulisphaera sp. GP187]